VQERDKPDLLGVNKPPHADIARDLAIPINDVVDLLFGVLSAAPGGAPPPSKELTLIYPETEAIA
jgi:hypothetical protein